jgi:HSP20 family molecular chaperone IbpA
MFREKCARCGKAIEKKFSFCPYCGYNIEEERELEDFGLLGKDDKKDIFGAGNAFGFSLNLNDIFNNFNSVFRNLTKDLNKSFDKDFDKTEPKVFSKAISIDLSPGKSPVIKVHSNGKKVPINFRVKTPEIKIPKLSEEKLWQLANLPKQEPLAEVRRLSNRVIYELNVPGVKSKEDIMINNLETGLEIIAIGKEKVYIKKIPMKLELLSYRIENEKLEAEFKA